MINKTKGLYPVYIKKRNQQKQKSVHQDKRKILKSAIPTTASKVELRRFPKPISGHSSLNTATSCGILDPARNGNKGNQRPL